MANKPTLLRMKDEPVMTMSCRIVRNRPTAFVPAIVTSLATRICHSSMSSNNADVNPFDSRGAEVGRSIDRIDDSDTRKVS